MENRTAEELGEGAEIHLFEGLKTEVPDDKISRIRKGTPGADILHIVMLAGKECGTILYDSKNHNQFRNEHVAKIKADLSCRSWKWRERSFVKITTRTY